VVCDSEASSQADPDGIEPVSQELTSEQDLTGSFMTFLGICYHAKCTTYPSMCLCFVGGDDMPKHPEWIETHTVDELKTIMECLRTCGMCSELIGCVWK